MSLYGKDDSNSNKTKACIGVAPSSNTKTADFTCTISDSANGVIKMDLTNSTTANIVAGKYYYDLELVNTSTSTVTRLIQGVARVTQEVTR